MKGKQSSSLQNAYPAALSSKAQPERYLGFYITPRGIELRDNYANRNYGLG